MTKKTNFTSVPWLGRMFFSKRASSSTAAVPLPLSLGESARIPGAPGAES